MLNHVTAKESLLLLKSIFDDNGVVFRLGYGTLLGAVREQDFIKGDNDIDLVLLQNQRNRVNCLMDKLLIKGFVVIKKCNCFITLKRKGTLIDLYFFDQRNFIDKFFNRYTCSYGVWCIYVPKHFLFMNFEEVFDEVNFIGKKFKTFFAHEAWLIRTYGDWTKKSNKKGNTRTFCSKGLMKARIYVRTKLKGVWFDFVYGFYLRLFK